MYIYKSARDHLRTKWPIFDRFPYRSRLRFRDRSRLDFPSQMGTQTSPKSFQDTSWKPLQVTTRFSIDQSRIFIASAFIRKLEIY